MTKWRDVTARQLIARAEERGIDVAELKAVLADIEAAEVNAKKEMTRLAYAQMATKNPQGNDGMWQFRTTAAVRAAIKRHEDEGWPLPERFREVLAELAAEENA